MTTEPAPMPDEPIYYDAAVDSAPVETLVPPAPVKRKMRKRSVLIAGALGALVLASAGTGIAATARVVSLQTATSATSTYGGSTTTTPGSGSSTGGTSGSGTTTTPSTVDSSGLAATDTQSAGIVLIDTVLKYEGAEAAGTGIVLTSTGEILTNNHVIDGATTITVTIASTGKTYTADVVGTNATSDVAVIKLEGASGLTTAKLDTSSDAAVADAVTAVGNAGGTGSLTAASGTITALDQTITAGDESGTDSETLNGLIETDAGIVAGDSGGPLYDADGEIIGIDTAASSGTAQTTGYAIPIEDALAIAKQITAGDDTDQITIGYPAFLGVEVAQSTTGGLQGQTETVAGATIAGVVDDTPAATAGLVEGDVITAVDGTAVTTTSLSTVLGAHAPGDSVTLSYTDAAGASHTVTVTLIEGAAD